MKLAQRSQAVVCSRYRDAASGAQARAGHAPPGAELASGHRRAARQAPATFRTCEAGECAVHRRRLCAFRVYTHPYRACGLATVHTSLTHSGPLLLLDFSCEAEVRAQSCAMGLRMHASGHVLVTSLRPVFVAAVAAAVHGRTA